MYIKPESVRSPKHLIRDIMVISDSGPNDNSYALIDNGEKVFLGMRTNGDDINPLGTPAVRGVSVWMSVSKKDEDLIINRLLKESEEEINNIIEHIKDSFFIMEEDFFMVSLDDTLPLYKVNLILLYISRNEELELLVDDSSPLPNNRLSLYKGKYYFGLKINKL